jgi:hypothetical protein
MTRFAIGLIIGILAGAALVATPPLVSDDIARVVSQRIYDCGIRIAANNGTISGFYISGHRHGLCIEDGVSGLSFDDVKFPDGNSWSWKMGQGVVAIN